MAGFRVFKKPTHMVMLLCICDHFLSTYMAFPVLWDRQCNLGEEKSPRLYAIVVKVCVCIFEILVKKIRRSDRNEPLPLGQSVTDRCIEKPEAVIA